MAVLCRAGRAIYFDAGSRRSLAIFEHPFGFAAGRRACGSFVEVGLTDS